MVKSAQTNTFEFLSPGAAWDFQLTGSKPPQREVNYLNLAK